MCSKLFTGFQWKEYYTPLVLALFREKPCLWDNKAPGYTSKVARDRAFEEMVKELGFVKLTVNDLKAKLYIICTLYSHELSNVEKSLEFVETGVYEIYVPKLFWYQQADTFLRSVPTPIIWDFINAIPNQNNELTSKVIEIYKGGDASSFYYKDPTCGDIAVTSDSENAMGTSFETNGNSSTHSSTPNVSVTPKAYTFGGMSSMEKAVDKLSQLFSKNKVTDTEFDYFTKSLSVQLKNMPFDRALLCQEKLQKVMIEERMFQYVQKSLTSTGTSTSIDMAVGEHHQPFKSRSESPVLSASSVSSALPELSTDISQDSDKLKVSKSSDSKLKQALFEAMNEICK